MYKHIAEGSFFDEEVLLSFRGVNTIISECPCPEVGILEKCRVLRWEYSNGEMFGLIGNIRS
jgi:hypothetical protein